MNGAIPFFGSFDYTPSEVLMWSMLALWIALLIFFMYKARQWRKNAK